MTLPSDRRILLVDDMPAIHEDFRKILVPPTAPAGFADAEAALFGVRPGEPRARFELDSAFRGQEAVALVEAALRAGRPYAVAFVDMRMPSGWDGVETVERLWRVDPNVQVVICTAYSDHAWEEVLARLEVRDRLLILKKPFDPIEVSQLAETLSKKWQLARQAASQVSSLEKAVRDLTAAEADLLRSNENLAAFAHSISHDLRSPLIAMSAFSKLLDRELADGASGAVRHYLSRIRASAGLGEQLIEGLLVLTRIARTQLQVESLDMTGMARQVLGEWRRAEPERHVSVNVHDGMHLQGDRRLMLVAMRHLLGNAWKFTSARARTDIEVGCHRDEAGRRVFFVRDNGDGFDMAYSGGLFHTFQRLHAQTRFPGAGMGLVTVARVVERHAGRIWAHSAPGEGATFSFAFPEAAGPVPAMANFTPSIEEEAPS